MMVILSDGCDSQETLVTLDGHEGDTSAKEREVAGHASAIKLLGDNQI